MLKLVAEMRVAMALTSSRSIGDIGAHSLVRDLQAAAAPVTPSA